MTAVTALALAGSLAMSLPAVADEEPEHEELKVVLVMDASGSMNGADPSGTTKIEAAKAALTEALETMPEDAHVGLRVYGATVDGPGRTPEECSDSQLVHPIVPLDKDGLTTAITSFDALGETPIAYSLLEAAKDLGDDGRRHIILVSDGEERCVPDPCAAVEEITDAGIGLQIDTVGFAVGSEARQQLTCIADAGGGSYFEAKDASELADSLNVISTRAARDFTIEGTPVVGTDSPEEAPVLMAGQYTDDSSSSTQGETAKYYRIARTMPGSTVRVNVLGRMPHASALDSTGQAGWDFELRTVDGTKCSSKWQLAGESGGMGEFISGTVLALPLDPRVQSPRDADIDCAESEEFVLEVKRKRALNSADTVDVEIRVIEEPPVVNLADLPDGVSSVPRGVDGVESPAQGEPAPVDGGAGFNDAVLLEPGTYVTEVVPGEAVFFRTAIDWGQSAVFAIDGPELDFNPVGLGPTSYLTVGGNVYAPDYSHMDSQQLWRNANYRWRGGVPEMSLGPDINRVPEVRYRNRWDSPPMHFGDSQGFAMAGDYFFRIAVGQRTSELEGIPVPIMFSIAVDGEVSGVPEFAEVSDEQTAQPETPSESPTQEESPVSPEPADPTGEVMDAPADEPAPVEGQEPDAADSTDATPSDGVSPLAVVGGALVGVGVLGAVGYGIHRRRQG